MYVVRVWPFDLGEDILTGQLLAFVELSKCGYEGPVPDLIAKHTKKADKGTKPTFALYAMNPDRQHEAVELLRELAEIHTPESQLCLGMDAKEIDKLSNQIEDGYITQDCYGQWLGVIEVDDMIDALKKEMENAEKCEHDYYRRFKWALTLLTVIKETWPEGGLKVITYGH
jgi:hypothetical protein